MTTNNRIKVLFSGHRILIVVLLCLFGLSVVQSRQPNKKKPRKSTNERVYLVHADVTNYDMFGDNPTAQVLKGRVAFRHNGARLFCDSAYLYQESNSFKAFGHVKMYQGDTLSLVSDYAYYDGNDQMAEARYNVVLKHRGTRFTPTVLTTTVFTASDISLRAERWSTRRTYWFLTGANMTRKHATPCSIIM